MYEDGAPHVSQAVWDLAEARGLPVLGICYGFQEMTRALGGRVDAAPAREFGVATLTRAPGGAADATGVPADSAGDLLAGLPSEVPVWMSHGDKIHAPPPGFVTLARSGNSEYAAVASVGRRNRLFGLQFHPEVVHTPCGRAILANFVTNIAGAAPSWTMGGFLDTAVATIRATVGPADHVIGAVSGGVDSTVAAALLARAIGARFHAVMVDNGLLRADERAQVLRRLRDELGVNLRAVDASARFLDKLAGVADPEAKRKIIGAEFIHVFEEEAAAITASLGAGVGGDGVGAGAASSSAPPAAATVSTNAAAPAAPAVRFLLQGTLYPDVIESISFKGPSATIKSHHNVGGLLAHMNLKLIEPLRELFKDEVRALGRALALPEDVLMRHPFPGPGLAIRVLGPVTAAACDVLRAADAIFLEELRAAGEYDKIGQAFAVLLPVKSVGVMGDARTYEQVLALRAVATSDFMTADWHRMPYDVLAKVSTRIINEVRGVNRVVYDVSSKPPATIEWE